MKDDKLTVTGVIIKILPNALFKVQTESGKEIKCTISGKIRKNMIRILLGDRVTVELSPYNLDLGTIIYNHK